MRTHAPSEPLQAEDGAALLAACVQTHQLALPLHLLCHFLPFCEFLRVEKRTISTSTSQHMKTKRHG